MSSQPVDMKDEACDTGSRRSYSASSSQNESIDEYERILCKKTFKGKTYYKVKCFGKEDYVWERANQLSGYPYLIEDYERRLSGSNNDDEENEWDVEKILDKRQRNNQTEYLIKWRGWSGVPTWELAENCTCINLIAAYENPKLQKMWNFTGSNQKLWLNRSEVLRYMRRYLRTIDRRVQLLRFKADYPPEEKPFELREGINIGPLVYENHWYLVIILVNYINITRKILIGDSLNVLIGTSKKNNPVIRRLQQVYPRYTIQPIAFTQMDRSDVCAYYVLAAFERALFLLDPNAPFIVDSVFFDQTRAELLRSQIKPATNGELSVSLPIPEALDQGITCEFCTELFDTRKSVDKHIVTKHFYQRRTRTGTHKFKK